MELEALRQELLAKGGLGSDWSQAVTRGLDLDDMRWNDGSQLGDRTMDEARRVMTKGGFLEYECYNDQKKPQGRAVVLLNDWEDYANGIFRAEHLRASDEYYEWYGQNKLKHDQGVYHLCSSKLKDCTVRLGRGDRRELVHIQRWRMVNPLVMAENEYMRTLAVQVAKDWVDNFRPVHKVPEPPGLPPPRAPSWWQGEG